MEYPEINNSTRESLIDLMKTTVDELSINKILFVPIPCFTIDEFTTLLNSCIDKLKTIESNKEI